MSSYLIADSGSTKTDWCLVKNSKKPVIYKTSGINPFLQTQEEILTMLQMEIPSGTIKSIPKAIYFYGAGAATKEKQQLVSSILKTHFGVVEVDVESDLLGAARAVCGENKGVICILGTGSASCYYNGKKIKEQQPSLGYIAGDEGSGNYMGKRVLQYYAYGTFDEELRMSFEMKFGDSIRTIINKLYHEPYPNRYLATFVSLLAENRGHYMVENLIEDCLNEFFNCSILKYRQSWRQPLHFIGSVADTFKDVIASLCDQYELEMGKVAKSPIDGLIKYHNERE